MSFDPEEILYGTVFESTPEETEHEQKDLKESDDLYDPWDDDDDPIERRRDPLRD